MGGNGISFELPAPGPPTIPDDMLAYMNIWEHGELFWYASAGYYICQELIKIATPQASDQFVAAVMLEELPNQYLNDRAARGVATGTLAKFRQLYTSLIQRKLQQCESHFLNSMLDTVQQLLSARHDGSWNHGTVFSAIRLPGAVYQSGENLLHRSSHYSRHAVRPEGVSSQVTAVLTSSKHTFIQHMGMLLDNSAPAGGSSCQTVTLDWVLRVLSAIQEIGGGYSSGLMGGVYQVANRNLLLDSYATACCFVMMVATAMENFTGTTRSYEMTCRCRPWLQNELTIPRDLRVESSFQLLHFISRKLDQISCKLPSLYNQAWVYPLHVRLLIPTRKACIYQGLDQISQYLNCERVKTGASPVDSRLNAAIGLCNIFTAKMIQARRNKDKTHAA